jgi:hypothetical protein
MLTFENRDIARLHSEVLPSGRNVTNFNIQDNQKKRPRARAGDYNITAGAVPPHEGEKWMCN